MSEARLGYIGLGNMGAPKARRLVGWPGGLIVYDVRPDAAAVFADAGATVAADVAEVAAADVISVTVLDDAQVRDVVAELARHSSPGTVVAIHSTIADSTAAELAAEYGPHGILVNCVSPGQIDTPMQYIDNPPEIVEAAIKTCPLRRIGRPDEVASVVVFLASSHASFVSGATINVSGGQTLY